MVETSNNRNQSPHESPYISQQDMNMVRIYIDNLLTLGINLQSEQTFTQEIAKLHINIKETAGNSEKQKKGTSHRFLFEIGYLPH